MLVVSTLVAGVVAGVVATIVMTILQMPAMKALGMSGPLPTAILWSRLAARQPEESAAGGILLHVVYGVFWGTVFALGVDAWLGLNAVAFGTLLGLGLALGAVLWVVSNLYWAPALGMVEAMAQMPREVRVRIGTTFLVLHLTYGAAAAGTVWALLPVAPAVPRLGTTVPAVGLAVLLVVLLAGYALRGRPAPRRLEPGRPA